MIVDGLSAGSWLTDSILADVCGYLPDETILAASLSCRRLNAIAIRVYLARNDIPDPALKCEVYLEGPESSHALGLLHALNLAAMTFFRSTDSLSLIFLNADLSLEFRDLAGAARLVKRLTHLREVSLEFRGTICENGIVTDQIIRKQWDVRFTELWMAILRNRSVASLAIRTKREFYTGYTLYKPTRPETGPMRTHLQGTMRTLLGRLWGQIQLAQTQLTLGTSVRRTSFLLPPGRLSITTFDVESPLLFLPEFYYLTLLTLRRSQIASLRLNLNAMLPENTWSRIFQDIVGAVPDLARLTIVNPHMRPQNLCRLILKFRRLVYLAIDPRTEYSRFSPASLSEPLRLQNIPRFAHLTELSIGREYLALFLKCADFNKVERLDIALSMSDMMSPSLLNDLGPIRQFPHLHIYMKLYRFSLNDLEGCIDFALGMSVQWEDVFGRVQDLALVRPTSWYDGGAVPDDDPMQFSRWLAHFPALRRVTWDSSSSDEFPFVLARQALYQSRVAKESATNGLPLDKTRNGLLDFPDELLIAIFEWLSEELFDLGLVSRRLNFLALPLFLVKQRIWDLSTRRCTINLSSYLEARDPIAALTVTLSLPDVKEVRITTPELTYIYPLLNYLRRLIPIMQRMSVVESVSICFGVPRNRQPGEHHAFLQYRWCSLFAELLNVVVSKPCTRLIVRGSPYLFPEATVWNHRLEHSKRVVISPPQYTKIISFSFEPSSLLSPVFLPWTTAVLQNSQITTLCIYVTIRDYDFFQVLADTFPHLRCLEIRRLGTVSGPLAEDRIFSLLSRLSELETLCILAPVVKTVSLVPPSGSPAPRLLQLKSLSATIPIINSLLTPGPLRSLHKLEIVVPLTSPSIPSPEESIATLFEDLRRHGLAPAVTLALVLNSNLFWQGHAFDNMLGSDWAQWSPYVIGLHVTVMPPVLVRRDVDYLSNLGDRLDRFPGLKEVSFSDGIADRSEAEEAKVAARLLRAVGRVRLQIQTIRVNGKECKSS
ncbi:hypothetical protein GGX14DRAFT_588482 [Mycena pura]|uniref:F-box domain-containing protein n=1 Tax=Mycena pura TaxID=153505 RepID=A0AAD6UWF0_9AGAR|nr:hypothetical protein GGX14DRAFT_588482 [Mycena pura]